MVALLLLCLFLYCQLGLARLFWEDSRPYSEGLAAVSDGLYWGFIDRLGRIVIEPQYYDAGYFYNGKAHCEVNEDITVTIDKKNHCITKEWHN